MLEEKIPHARKTVYALINKVMMAVPQKEKDWLPFYLEHQTHDPEKSRATSEKYHLETTLPEMPKQLESYYGLYDIPAGTKVDDIVSKSTAYIGIIVPQKSQHKSGDEKDDIAALNSEVVCLLRELATKSELRERDPDKKFAEHNFEIRDSYEIQGYKYFYLTFKPTIKNMTRLNKTCLKLHKENSQDAKKWEQRMSESFDMGI